MVQPTGSRLSWFLEFATPDRVQSILGMIIDIYPKLYAALAARSAPAMSETRSAAPVAKPASVPAKAANDVKRNKNLVEA